MRSWEATQAEELTQQSWPELAKQQQVRKSWGFLPSSPLLSLAGHWFSCRRRWVIAFARLPPTSHFFHLLNYLISNQEWVFSLFELSVLSPFPLWECCIALRGKMRDWVTLCGCLVARWRQPTRIHRRPKTFNTSSLYKGNYLITYELPCCDLSLLKKDCILFNFHFISNILFSLIWDQVLGFMFSCIFIWLLFHSLNSLSMPCMIKFKNISQCICNLSINFI